IDHVAEKSPAFFAFLLSFGFVLCALFFALVPELGEELLQLLVFFLLVLLAEWLIVFQDEARVLLAIVKIDIVGLDLSGFDLALPAQFFLHLPLLAGIALSQLPAAMVGLY